MKNKREPKLLGNSLGSLLRNLGIQKKIKKYEVIARWDTIVGEEVSQVTKADRICDEILFVKVTTSSWRNELVFMKYEILQKISNTIGAGIIKDIRFI